MKKEWKHIAQINGAAMIVKKLREEIAELDKELETYEQLNEPLRFRFDELLSELADVQACIDQLVHWHRLRKPFRAMTHYKAQRQLWRFRHENDKG